MSIPWVGLLQKLQHRREGNPDPYPGFSNTCQVSFLIQSQVMDENSLCKPTWFQQQHLTAQGLECLPISQYEFGAWNKILIAGPLIVAHLLSIFIILPTHHCWDAIASSHPSIGFSSPCPNWSRSTFPTLNYTTKNQPINQGPPAEHTVPQAN